MKIILTSLFFLLYSSHEIQVAFFKIYQEDNRIYIDFIFESDDIFSTLEEQDTGLTDEHFKEYVENNFSLSLNNYVQEITFDEMQFKDKHIHLRGVLPESKEPIKSISLENNCLINIEGHSNIIEFRLYDQERDFLMNIHRTKISIRY